MPTGIDARRFMSEAPRRLMKVEPRKLENNGLHCRLRTPQTRPSQVSTQGKFALDAGI
jgi:hypothetical protein